MKRRKLTAVRLTFTALAVLGTAYAILLARWNPQAGKSELGAAPPTYLKEHPWPSAESCRRCHSREYDEWSQSFHRISSSGPTFQAMYRIYTYNTGGKDPSACLNCHAPETQVKGNYAELHQKIMDEEQYHSEGITCVTCHALRDVGKIDYDPYVKLDLAPKEMPPYHDYMVTDLHRGNDLCAKCHDYQTTQGADCCTPTRDWEKTSFAKRDIGCIDCHMRDEMGLMADNDSLKQSLLESTGLAHYQDDRRRVSHLFPGQHNAEFMKRSVTMSIEAEKVGGDIDARVVIKNRTGHSIPNG